MIEATARVLKNVIEVQVGAVAWEARPVQAGQQGLGSRVAALFSTEYHVFRPEQPNEPHAALSYQRKNDEIRIQVGEQHWRTVSSAFGPMTIEYHGVRYTINERITGRFAILRGNDPVGVGQLGFRSCRIDDYPADLEPFLALLGIGYVIRTLAWVFYA